MTTTDATAEKGGRKLNLAPVQKFGRRLMLPIASLPAAALLLRLGQPDLLGADGLGVQSGEARERRLGGGGRAEGEGEREGERGNARGVARQAHGGLLLRSGQWQLG